MLPIQSHREQKVLPFMGAYHFDFTTKMTNYSNCKIVLFTANVNGGIVQLAIQLLKELSMMEFSVNCFIPDVAQYSCDEQLAHQVNLYKKVNAIWKNDRRVKKIARQITDLSPDLVWYVDTSPLSAEVGLCLTGKTCQIYSVHDPSPHPTNEKLGFKRSSLERWKQVLRYFFLRKVDYIATFSQVSRERYADMHPKFREKLRVVNLGAHIPDVSPVKPAELIGCERYYLFFGRIDKYKGIADLVKAFNRLDDNYPKLVIAGSGSLTPDEEHLITLNLPRIVLLNRFISDSEMVYLFEHSLAVVLPYVEASQSGIIPIAYKVGKPVITSDLDGLTQFVENGITGLVCSTSNELENGLRQMADAEFSSLLGNNARKYYLSNLEWRQSLQKFLGSINIR